VCVTNVPTIAVAQKGCEPPCSFQVSTVLAYVMLMLFVVVVIRGRLGVSDECGGSNRCSDTQMLF
jgi:hypothetical protein